MILNWRVLELSNRKVHQSSGNMSLLLILCVQATSRHLTHDTQEILMHFKGVQKAENRGPQLNLIMDYSSHWT